MNEIPKELSEEHFKILKLSGLIEPYVRELDQGHIENIVQAMIKASKEGKNPVNFKFDCDEDRGMWNNWKFLNRDKKISKALGEYGAIIIPYSGGILYYLEKQE